jgi:pimeloyl-ACP methyl ester carboxylesterase
MIFGNKKLHFLPKTFYAFSLVNNSLVCQYIKVGHGPKMILGFHGIGQDAQALMPLTSALPNYTFFLFDLPFHGRSPALSTEKLSVEDWKGFLEVFLAQNQIHVFGVMGFSMGGKFALATLQLFPQQVKSCWLFAPDGVTESPWYTLATRFWFTKWAFRTFVMNVNHFKKLAIFLVWVGLVNKSAVKFAQSTLATPVQRERVYKSWVGFSSIRADIPKVADIVRHYSVDLKIFLGQFDALLPLHYMNPLTKRLPSVKPIVLKTGHHRLIEKAAEWLKK